MTEYLTEGRFEYDAPGFDIADTDPDPMVQFAAWYAEAVESSQLEPNAITLSTISGTKPSSRIVLLKFTDQGGFTFFTDYSSSKATHIADNDQVALCVLWQSLHRQVRIEGSASRVPLEVSDSYFASRPRGSRLAAIASDQSRQLADRETLIRAMKKAEETWEGQEPPRPDWGGFLVKPHRIEFWQGQPNRLHDRILYVPDQNGWQRVRLAP